MTRTYTHHNAPITHLHAMSVIHNTPTQSTTRSIPTQLQVDDMFGCVLILPVRLASVRRTRDPPT